MIDWTKVEDWDEDIANEKLDHSITEVQFFETAKNSECFRSLQDVFPELTDEVIGQKPSVLQSKFLINLRENYKSLNYAIHY